MHSMHVILESALVLYQGHPKTLQVFKSTLYLKQRCMHVTAYKTAVLRRLLSYNNYRVKV